MELHLPFQFIRNGHFVIRIYIFIYNYIYIYLYVSFLIFVYDISSHRTIF